MYILHVLTAKLRVVVVMESALQCLSATFSLMLNLEKLKICHLICVITLRNICFLQSFIDSSMYFLLLLGSYDVFRYTLCTKFLYSILQKLHFARQILNCGTLADNNLFGPLKNGNSKKFAKFLSCPDIYLWISDACSNRKICEIAIESYKKMHHRLSEETQNFIFQVFQKAASYRPL